jgi:DNA-binding beta-propeller fold protein YncE
MSASRQLFGLALVLLASGCDEPGDRFDRPTAVAFGPAGEVYVSDGYNHSRIARFTKDGRFVDEWGKRGAGEGEFRTPHGVCVDSEGRVYVADRENARVAIFERDGEPVTTWPSALVGRPWGVACGKDGFIYVVDGGDQDPERPRGGVTKLTRDGRVVARGGAGWGLEGGHSLAVGPDGTVYVAEAEGHRIRKLVPRQRP